ncbi:hypothetical protein AMAG_16032 [Allomyces macrogynus ATCC 38327]|uniref:Uncharacterized protein n=1 Tax=Allomyces macrogynus (strain ATCC 38327) TaxID=578462 RepID=A0A0L0TAI0_ALLM3|nr:hypothetical protein AMAG_16032 [Allomyces macrogynus ATCC 38327]|eukprot:KNE71726.1 hypothetical protein AMAG_16032 [Allomyces macrogynus ATCC 38327]
MTALNPTMTAPLEYLGTICRAADGSYQVLNMDEAELSRFLAFMITKGAADAARPLESAAIGQVQEQGDAGKTKENERDPKVQLDARDQDAGASSAAADSEAAASSSGSGQQFGGGKQLGGYGAGDRWAIASATINNESRTLAFAHSNLRTHASSAVSSDADLADLFANLAVEPPLLLDGYDRYFQEVSLMHVTLNQETMRMFHSQILPCKRSESLTGNWCSIALFDPTSIWNGDWAVAWASIHGPGDIIEKNSVYAVPVHDYSLSGPNPGSWAVTTPLRAVDMNPEDFAWFCFVPESKWPQVDVIGVLWVRSDLNDRLRQETGVCFSYPGMISHDGSRLPFACLTCDGLIRDLYCPLVYDAPAQQWVMDEPNLYFNVVKLGLVETSIQLDEQQSRWHRVENMKSMSKKWRIGR